MEIELGTPRELYVHYGAGMAQSKLGCLRTRTVSHAVTLEHRGH